MIRKLVCAAIVVAGLSPATPLSPADEKIVHAVNEQHDKPRPPNHNTSHSNQTQQQPQWRKVELTWYSPHEGTGEGLITATGTHVRNNYTIAVDPDVIPLGSLVEIRFADGSTHLYHADDTGGAIKGAHIDIFNYDRNQCLRNGVQWAEYRIIKRGD